MDEKKKEGWVGAGLLLLLVVIGMTTCGESDSEKQARAEAFAALPVDQKIKSISSDITEVDEVVKGEALMITFFKPSIWSGKNWTWNFLETAKDVLSRMGEVSQGVPYKRVTFMAQIPTTDNLGHEGSQLGMKVTYDLDKLRGANWQNMTTFDVAELADDISFRPLGTDAVVEYCNDGDKFKYTPTFCERAVESAMRLQRY